MNAFEHPQATPAPATRVVVAPGATAMDVEEVGRPAN
jgi:hypothetical protein